MYALHFLHIVDVFTSLWRGQSLLLPLFSDGPGGAAGQGGAAAEVDLYVVTGDCFPLETCCHIKDDSHALIFLRLRTSRFASVYLHVPCIAGPGIACCPYCYPIFPWFSWDVLLKWTATSERDQALIHSHITAWIIY